MFCTFKLLFLLPILLHNPACAQPNIIIIIADDLGYNDVGFRGSNQSVTPNIDALAYNGVILDRFYTQQSCTPSRAALLTGKYPFKIGMQGIPITAGENRFLPTDLVTLPEKLKELGYSTHLVGKWHLGASRRDVTPTMRGFDTHFGYWHGYVGYFNYFASSKYKNMTGLDLHDGFEPVWSLQNRYATEVFTEKTVEFIEGYNSTQPYFLMVSHLAPHAGYNDAMEVPDLQETNKKYAYIPNPNRRLSVDTVNRLDESVGKIIKALSEKGDLQNSIVMFLSDNGAQTFGEHENFGSNWPLRGLKFTLFEGAVKGTAVIYSPLFQQTGVINSELMHITDLLPTFYAAAGGNSSDLPQIDGTNQWDVLTQNQTTTRTEIVLEIDESENYSGFLNKRYKLINGTIFLGNYDANSGESGRDSYNPPYNTTAVLQSDTHLALLNRELTEHEIFEIRKRLDLSGCNGKNFTSGLHCGGFCLFDLLDDPCETKDISEKKPELLEEMKEKLASFWKEIVPHKIGEPEERADPKNYNNTWVPWRDYCHLKL